MAVSGPLFRDLTPPNLEFRTKKKAPRYIRAIFPTRCRLFDGTHFCPGGNPRFGIRSAVCGPRSAICLLACLLVVACYFACAVGKSCLWAWQSSDLGDPGALEGTTRPGEALICLTSTSSSIIQHLLSSSILCEARPSTELVIGDRRSRC